MVSKSYRNPIIPGFNPDPSMIYHNGWYYLVTSSFEYFPGIPVYKSSNLVDWKLVGHVLTRRSQLDMRQCEPGGGIFAPCLRYNRHDERFYVAVCALHRMKQAVSGDPGPQPRGFIVSTDDIEGEWSDPVYVDNMGIDQDLFFDDDGTTYLSVARPYPSSSPRFNLGVFSTSINLQTGRSLQPSILARVSATDAPIAEGPHIFKKDGVYYMIVAEGGTEMIHQEWILRSSSPLGPWEEGPSSVNPLVFNFDHPEIRQTGHMDLCEGQNGRWWAVFLGVRPQLGPEGDRHESQLGRETFLCPVEWKDGWPVVNGGKKVTINGGDIGLPRNPKDYEIDYPFTPDRDLRLDGWYSLRTPLYQNWSLEQSGSLSLLGGPQHFRYDEWPTMLFIKQQSFIAEFTASLQFRPSHVDEEAGVTVWWSKWNFASVSIRACGDREARGMEVLRKAQSREVVFRKPDLGVIGLYKESTWPLSGTSVSMRIHAQPTEYTFFATIDGKEHQLGSMSSDMLTRIKSPIEWMFTGTHFGLFACGARDQPCFDPAVFSKVYVRGVRDGGD